MRVGQAEREGGWGMPRVHGAEGVEAPRSRRARTSGTPARTPPPTHSAGAARHAGRRWRQTEAGEAWQDSRSMEGGRVRVGGGWAGNKVCVCVCVCVCV